MSLEAIIKKHESKKEAYAETTPWDYYAQGRKLRWLLGVIDTPTLKKVAQETVRVCNDIEWDDIWKTATLLEAYAVLGDKDKVEASLNAIIPNATIQLLHTCKEWLQRIWYTSATPTERNWLTPCIVAIETEIIKDNSELDVVRKSDTLTDTAIQKLFDGTDFATIRQKVLTSENFKALSPKAQENVLHAYIKDITKNIYLAPSWEAATKNITQSIDTLKKLYLCYAGMDMDNIGKKIKKLEDAQNKISWLKKTYAKGYHIYPWSKLMHMYIEASRNYEDKGILENAKDIARTLSLTCISKWWLHANDLRTYATMLETKLVIAGENTDEKTEKEILALVKKIMHKSKEVQELTTIKEAIQKIQEAFGKKNGIYTKIIQIINKEE